MIKINKNSNNVDTMSCKIKVGLKFKYKFIFIWLEHCTPKGGGINTYLINRCLLYRWKLLNTKEYDQWFFLLLHRKERIFNQPYKCWKVDSFRVVYLLYHRFV